MLLLCDAVLRSSLIIIVIILMTCLWRCHHDESSPSSSDQRRTAPVSCRPSDQPIDSGCESAYKRTKDEYKIQIVICLDWWVSSAATQVRYTNASCMCCRQLIICRSCMHSEHCSEQYYNHRTKCCRRWDRDLEGVKLVGIQEPFSCKYMQKHIILLY